jgi:polyhydroxyalkanoate synthesis regulator phasin
MAMTVQEIADEMFKLVSESQEMGKKLKPMDLTKYIRKAHEEVDKKDCKSAIRDLVDSGKLVYSYFGGTFLEIPRIEGAAND